MNKLFKKSATITTSDNGKYQIESSRVFIMPKYRKNYRIKHKYGNEFTIKKVSENGEPLVTKDISFIGEIYSFDNDRLRFLMDTYKDATVIDTELHDNGKELPITVIENYSDKTQCIASIGNIIKFDSDIEEQSYKLDIKVLRLLLKAKLDKEKGNKKDL